MIKEYWKDVPGYEGLYQVSNLGSVKSLDRYVNIFYDKKKFLKGRVLKPCINKGYYRVTLCKKSVKVHQLVAMAFLGHIPNGHNIVVDHINRDKLDNRLSNIRLVTQRENSNNRVDKSKSKSKYIGVYWEKRRCCWWSQIYINGKRKYLGSFKTEHEAHLAYQKALKESI